MQIDEKPRWRWAASSVGAGLAAAIVGSAPVRSMVIARWPLVLGCTLLVIVGLAGVVGGARVRHGLGPVVATLRLAIVLLAGALWLGNGTPLWGLLAVAVAWHDARARMAPGRPLVPVSIALAIAMCWSAYRPGPAGARVMIVAAIAGLAAALAANRSTEN